MENFGMLMEKRTLKSFVGTWPNYDTWLDVVQANDFSRKWTIGGQIKICKNMEVDFYWLLRVAVKCKFIICTRPKGQGAKCICPLPPRNIFASFSTSVCFPILRQHWLKSLTFEVCIFDLSSSTLHSWNTYWVPHEFTGNKYVPFPIHNKASEVN